MLRLMTPGCLTLVLATSCVPVKPPVASAARIERAVEPRALLHRLALDVPDDSRDLAPGPADTSVSVPVTAAPPFVESARSLDDTARAIECLTAAVYYEARSESVDGQRAVAQVVLNRVRDRAFPNSICGVVYQGSARRTGCQFSFTCDGSMDRPREAAAWSRAKAVAIAALAGSVYAPVGSATYYHASGVMPWWAGSLSRIGWVGSHLFYRWRGAMERALAFRQSYAGYEPVGMGAADALASTVAIHRGDDQASGVTVHRGATAPSATVRTLSIAGVRVHFGAVGQDDATPVEGQAIVSEESGPI